MISPCTPQLLIFIHEPINLHRTLWSFTYMANVTNPCHFILETILQHRKPPGGGKPGLWSKFLWFWHFFFMPSPDINKPVLENDGLTWKEKDLSSPGEFCIGSVFQSWLIQTEAKNTSSLCIFWLLSYANLLFCFVLVFFFIQLSLLFSFPESAERKML